MKKKSVWILLLLALFIVPQMVFAAWWNPFTWKIFKTSWTYTQTKTQVATSTPMNVTTSKNTPTPKSTPTKSVTSTKLTNAEIIKKVKPAVVYIETESGAGSGMVISSDGYVLTNAHVVSGITNAKVTISNWEILNAVVVGRDEKIDLALLKIDRNNLSSVIFGDSNIVEQGDDVFTLGYPFGLKGDVSFKEGTISRRINDGSGTYLETSAEIHPGNSGGPLVNIKGQVIGVNTAVLGNSVKGVAVGETIKFAIPINIAKELIPELKAGKQVVIPKTDIPPGGNPFQSEDSNLKIAKCQAEKQASYNSGVQIFEQKLQEQLNSDKIQITQKRNARIAEINTLADQNKEVCMNQPNLAPYAVMACIQDNTNQTMKLLESAARTGDEEWAQAKRNSEASRQTFINKINPILDQSYFDCLNK